MFLRIFVITLFYITLFAPNCLSESLCTPIDYFYKKHPELKDNYKEFNPTSYYGLKLRFTEKYISIIGLIENIKEEFSDSPDLVEYLTNVEEFERKKQENIRDEFGKLEKKITKDDYFYYFEYEDSRFKESGFLILNDGEIKLREVSVRAFKNKD